MASIKQIISLIISLLAFVWTFYAVGKFMIFLSIPRQIHMEYTWIINMLDNKSRFDAAFPPIVFDMLWIIGFILQHSLMNSQIVRNILNTVGLDLAERGIYCLTSSISLWYLINNWKSAPTLVLWQIDVSNSSPLWWTFVLIHVFAWIIIYGGSVIMDLPEIIGIKQVYYDMKDYISPMAYKSFELRSLYSHVRHPSFTGLTIVLWVTNIMTLDRLLLATMLTLYMYIAWSTDPNDVLYHKFQLRKKREELKRIH